MPETIQISKSDDAPECLWPSREYDEQVEKLRGAIGQPVYFVELKESEIHLTLEMQSKSFKLLDLVSFPAPDPSRRLYPHMVILDDGRGINLGRIVRISVNEAYDPQQPNVLYQESFLFKHLMRGPRGLSNESIKQVSRSQLARFLGKPLETRQRLPE